MSNLDVSVGSHPFSIWQVLSVARTVGGLVSSEKIGEMEKELTKVIEDFDRAVNIEALRLAKETGTHSLSQCEDSQFSGVSCRARTFAWAAEVCGSWLFLEQPLYGWYPAIYPQSNHGLGDEPTGNRGGSMGAYLLGLRLTWNRENVVSSFDL